MLQSFHTWPSGSSGESKLLKNDRNTWSSVHSPFINFLCFLALNTLDFDDKLFHSFSVLLIDISRYTRTYIMILKTLRSYHTLSDHQW